MYIETERLIIRDLEHKDAKQLFKIVWQKGVVSSEKCVNKLLIIFAI